MGAKCILFRITGRQNLKESTVFGIKKAIYDITE
jgi:hypothetical protein